jgi:hypothetical protein
MQGILEDMGRKGNPAGYALERMTSLIRSFQASIGDEVEVGISVAGSGLAWPFRLRAINAESESMALRGVSLHCPDLRAPARNCLRD